MNTTQKILFAIYLPLTLLILKLDPTSPTLFVVQSIRYITILTLFLSVAIIKKKYPEQKMMSPAFFFMALGDFFLVFIFAIPSIQADLSWVGITSFLVGYLFLIKAYRKKRISKQKEIMSLIPFLILSFFVASRLGPYMHGPMILIAVAFILILDAMSWCAVCTLFQNYYSKKAAVMIAISGILMYICDMGIAFSLFDPYYSTVYIPLLKNIVWASYISGWTLAACVIAEDNLYTGKKEIR